LTEYELVQKVKKILEIEYTTYEEVKIFTRSIDLLLKKNNQLISIEFKLNNWKKAFEQISDYLLVSDYSYLCIPKKKLSSKTIFALKNNGIGLFSYDKDTNKLTEIIKPIQSKVKINFYKNHLLNKLNEKA
jgi:hypothetical protein